MGESQGFDQVVADDSAADTGAFGQDDSEFNLFTTDRQLAALQTAATMLGHLSGGNEHCISPAGSTSMVWITRPSCTPR